MIDRSAADGQGFSEKLAGELGDLPAKLVVLFLRGGKPVGRLCARSDVNSYYHSNPVNTKNVNNEPWCACIIFSIKMLFLKVSKIEMTKKKKKNQKCAPTSYVLMTICCSGELASSSFDTEWLYGCSSFLCDKSRHRDLLMVFKVCQTQSSLCGLHL